MHDHQHHFQQGLALVVFAGLLLGAMPVSAQVATVQHEWEVAGKVSHIRYEEPNIMEENGVMFGGMVAYTYRPVRAEEAFTRFATVLRVEGELNFGQVDYESVSTGSIDDVDDWLFEIRGLMGHDFFLNDSWRMTPYVGIGYRYLNDDLSGKTSTTGHVGYERESNYYYLPLGVTFLTQLDNAWQMGANIEFDIFLAGQQESHLSDVSSSLSDITNDQESGYGVRGSVKFVKTGDHVSWMVEPYARFWHIDDSDLTFIGLSGGGAVFGLEPENESLEVGARFGIQF